VWPSPILKTNALLSSETFVNLNRLPGVITQKIVMFTNNAVTILQIWKPSAVSSEELQYINPLSPELNPICYLLALLAHDFLHVSTIRVKYLTLRLLMSYIYIYGAPTLDVSRSHTTTQHSR
jgi:hypothetical protein